MLELRPNCELCDRDLPPNAIDARICSYECTYCAACADDVLKNVCPTCGGGLSPRPIRPEKAYRHPEISLGLLFHPAGRTRKHSRWDREAIAAMTARLASVPPEER
ncbi:DUF1272 domain-containing protein [Caulobacter segnis]|uniref:DUF1272 domain-containing protein n=2 Tax=Caulobacter segnis TaxID=88688 RepID=D5VMR4_CAUST|nr:DUF1272 domain-containing protein [Caulobacter segnis]ADG11787.1 protein of unknown function DUF1272 [Caulobacter segnis ATCC 21756]AVQ03425.1 DUF1272 domain-containing protein [Caulobacter segnis]